MTTTTPKTTFAVISTAEIARNKVVPAILSVPLASLVGVSSRDRERAQAFVDEHCRLKEDDDDAADSDADGDNDAATPPCVGMTHDEALTSPRVDAVYVPLPSRLRRDYIVKALINGKHVYSEKPHGGTVKELKTILDLAVGRNLQWMDGTMWYHSERTKVMEEKLFVKRELGEVRRVSASFTWGGGGLVDEPWVEGGNGRTDPAREAMGMLGDSGHYPISAACWAFGWRLPSKVRATHTKFNSLGAIIECEAVMSYAGGGRAVIDTSCLLPHRSQFEVVCERGVIKVDDLVGGQGRSGNFGAYEGPFVGSSSFVVGDHLGKDTVVEVEPCDHVRKLVEKFCERVRTVKEGGKVDPDWNARSYVTHAVMCAVFESAMRGGADVEIRVEDGYEMRMRYVIQGETFADIPTGNWGE